MIPLIGLLLGLLLGLFLNIEIPDAFSVYIGVLILALMTSMLGAIVARLKNEFSVHSFLSGLVLNCAFALVLSGLGEQLELPLSFAAVFAFGNRMYYHCVCIRKILIARYEDNKSKKQDNSDVSAVENDPDTEP